MAMRLQSLLLGVLLLTGFAAADSKTTCVIPSHYSSASLNRSNFPSGFVFGSASASYQYEGAWDEGGKGPSIWDNFTHQYPEKIIDGSNGDVADDQYHRYKEDVKIMKDMRLDAYRFSISWSRLLPNGKLSGGVNKEGVQYYNNLINELLNKGVTPYATIFHWDLPQALEEEYGGFLHRQIVNHFRDYAELCFKLFGDRVKHWITLNEPYTFITFGYASGELAPGRCSAWQNLNCTGGDSATEPYIVAHHFLLAHAHAVKVYKTKYQASQEGVIGITLATNWFVPVSNATRHRNAANRSLDFMFGWFMEPLTSGQYPHSMQVLVKERLPNFTQEESKLIKGSFDFVGMNYYTTHYSSDQPHNNSANASFLTDARVFESTERNGVPIGPPAASSWLVVYPKGIREILLYAKHKYNNPLIYITENGELAPGRCSAWQNLNCTGGDSATEPYIVAHHFLLAHAHAVKVYKTKYQASQEGVIGITLATNWFVPVSNATRHRNAANRSLDFMFGWFMEPLTSGQYPHSMQVLVKERLPNFTQEESKLIKGSFDFVGMNYYTTHYSSDQPHNNSANASFLTDARVFESTERNGVPIGPPAASSWLVVYPKGIREILLYAKHKYNNPLIYITENGLDEFDDPTLSLPQSLNDTHRIDYHYHHLDYLRKAINDGVNVKGYFAWSLLDNFEWASGYTLRFGFVYIDYNDGLKRHPKCSASWFKQFLG